MDGFIIEEVCRSPWVMMCLDIPTRSEVLDLVKAKPRVFVFCKQEFKCDFEIALAAVSRMPQLMPYLDESLRTKEFEMELVRTNGDALGVCRFKYDEEVAFAAVQTSGMALKFCEPFQSKARIVRAAVQQNGNAFIYASNELQKDDEIIACALQTSPEAVFLLSMDNQAQWLPTALSYRGWLLMDVHPDLKTLELVLCAVKNDGLAAPFAPTFLDNKTVALAAVSQCGRALRYFSRRMQDDEEVVLAALRKDGSAIQYSSSRLQDELAEEALMQSPYAFVHLSLQKRSDKELVLRVVSKAGNVIGFASPELKADHEVMLAAVKNYGTSLRWAPENLKANFEISHAAVSQNKLAFYYSSLKDNRQLAMLAVEHGQNFEFVSNRLKNDAELAMLSVANYTAAFYWASLDLQNGGLVAYMTRLNDAHTAFMYFMLISNHRETSDPFKRARLSVLINKHGRYFGRNFKKLIAQYCGVAVGKDYETLLIAIRNSANRY